MRLLLDTHALLWALSQPARLPARVASELRDPASLVYVSAVTSWEIVIKSALGKLSVDPKLVERAIATTGFVELPVTIAHALALAGLPLRHRDPFDRLLVAQAFAENLAIATHDRAFEGYGVPVFWG